MLPEGVSLSDDLPKKPHHLAMPTPDQSPRGSLPSDEQQQQQQQQPCQVDTTMKKQKSTPTLGGHSIQQMDSTLGGPAFPLPPPNRNRKTTLPANFFTQSSPPLPISPLSSFGTSVATSVSPKLQPRITTSGISSPIQSPSSSTTTSPSTPSPPPLLVSSPQPTQSSTPSSSPLLVSSDQSIPSSTPVKQQRQRHRRSILMDRDIRKKLQHMKMTPTPQSDSDDGTGCNEWTTDDDDTDTQHRQPISSSARRANSMRKPLGRHKLTMNNFILEKTVGTGSFGRVHLAQGRTTGRFYAIKALRKQQLVDRRQVEHANNERVILRSVDHPFVVKLWDTFQDEAHVFFVMDYLPGGELFRILRKNKYFSESTARFYAGEVLLAIEYLHHLDIAYRDIKPENILLDAQGHIKLADFGFSKKVLDLTWTVCGTPDYIAPEIIESQGYTKAVDWWAFGILVFEMVMGEAPFQAVNPVDKYQMILDCNIKYLPNRMSNDLVDLLQHLLKVNPTERYGNLKDGADDIKRHPWFKKMDFVKLSQCQVKPPYIPQVKHAGDTSCFQSYTEPNTPYGSIMGDNTDDDDDFVGDNEATNTLKKNQGSVGDPFSGF